MFSNSLNVLLLFLPLKENPDILGLIWLVFGVRGGLRKSWSPSSARSSEPKAKEKGRGMVPGEPWYELAGHRTQGLGTKT